MSADQPDSPGLVHPGLPGTVNAEVAHGDRTVVLMVGGHCAWAGDPDQARGLGRALITQAGYSERIVS